VIANNIIHVLRAKNLFASIVVKNLIRKYQANYGQDAHVAKNVMIIMKK